MSSSQSLQRIFSSSDPAKFPTLSKYLSVSKNTAARAMLVNDPAAPASTAVDNNDENLAFLDQLIEQSLAKRLVDENNEQVGVGQSGLGRNKEVLGQTIPSEVTNQDLSAAQSAEAQVNLENINLPEKSADGTTEIKANPELADLSKEIQEMSKETQEQREQALIKEKQQALNQLAAEASAPLAISNKPVVVLPITVKSKEEAKFKSTKYSVRWLIEWCQKITKMFAGAVVYKEEVDHE